MTILTQTIKLGAELAALIIIFLVAVILYNAYNLPKSGLHGYEAMKRHVSFDPNLYVMN